MFKVDEDMIEPNEIHGEEWRFVLEGKIAVSNMGRYRSEKKSATTPVKNEQGYVIIQHKGKCYGIHRLICESWHGSPPAEMYTVDLKICAGRRNESKPLIKGRVIEYLQLQKSR